MPTAARYAAMRAVALFMCCALRYSLGPSYALANQGATVNTAVDDVRTAHRHKRRKRLDRANGHPPNPHPFMDAHVL